MIEQRNSMKNFSVVLYAQPKEDSEAPMMVSPGWNILAKDISDAVKNLEMVLVGMRATDGDNEYNILSIGPIGLLKDQFVTCKPGTWDVDEKAEEAKNKPLDETVGELENLDEKEAISQ